MARPRIFISSTFYDLKHVRNDLERFVKELGYDPVLNERGQIAYGRTERLETYCYKEISNCEILINLVGGRFGSSSSEKGYSISQVELRTAHKLSKQIYVFVEKPVHFEYQTFLKNETNDSFVPQYADDLRIYHFLKEVNSLGLNNAIFDFESVREVTDILREQWAGLFQRFLQQEARLDDFATSANLKSTAELLTKIVEHTTKERDNTIKNILVHSHPVFNQIASVTGIRIRILFFTVDEMRTLLSTFGYAEIVEKAPEWSAFQRLANGKKYTLRVSTDIFDLETGNLVAVEPGHWDDKFIEFQKEDVPSEDDVPF